MKSTLWKNGDAVKSKGLPKKPDKEKLENKPEQMKTYGKLTDTTIKTEEAKNG